MLIKWPIGGFNRIFRGKNVTAYRVKAGFVVSNVVIPVGPTDFLDSPTFPISPQGDIAFTISPKGDTTLSVSPQTDIDFGIKFGGG